MLDQTKKQKIIFSADDFGVNALANANILQLAKAGKLDRVEVMINTSLSKADALALQATGVKLDIHLHLIDYDCDYWQGNRHLERGALKRIGLFIANYLSGKSNVQKVTARWEDQIEKFRELFGAYPAGVGSHEYIHFFPPYFKIALNLCEKYQINFLRFGNTAFHHSTVISKILNWLRGQNIPYFKKTNLETSDYLVSFDWTNNLDFVADLPKESRVEVVFHPERKEEWTFLQNC